MLFAASFPVQAATYAFFQPTIQVLKPVNFLNGSFENESNPIPRGNYTYYQQNNVVGWRTVPINPSYNGWSYSDYIQIGQPSTSGDWPVAVPDGSKYTELSCEYPSRLYQNIATVPGTRIYWEFSHTRLMYERNWVYYYNPLLFPPTTGDILQFTLRPAGNPQATPTGAQIISTSLAPRTQSDTWYVRKGYYDVPAGQTNTEFGFAGIQSVISQLNAGNFLDNVKFQTGASLIAEKAIYNSSGSRIDGGYGEYSDIVTIVIKVTNWGETDAAPCVLTDTLWDGLQFVNGSVGGDSGVAGSVSCDAGGNVTAYLGEGAGSAAGGTLKGSKAMNTSATTGKGEQAIVTIRAKITGAPGSVVKDQASVAYNDKGFEAYNPSGKTSYSLIDYGIPDANNLNVAGQNGSFAMNILNADGTVARTYRNVNPGNPETYVNQFTIVDRQTNGTLWYDSNGNGDIDAGESRLSGVNLKMQKLDSGTWTDAQDWSQTPLTAQSGADGSYTFRGILSGQYRVLAELPEASRVVGFKSSAPPAETTAAVGTQGSCDNDADAGTVTDGGTTWAVVQTLDKTGQAFTPAASIYYTHNADFGFVPTIRAEKSAKVVRTQDVSPGTAAAPTGVLYGDTIEYKIGRAHV